MTAGSLVQYLHNTSFVDADATVNELRFHRLAILGLANSGADMIILMMATLLSLDATVGVRAKRLAGGPLGLDTF